MSTVAPSDQRPTEEHPDGHSATDTLGEVVAQVKPKLRGWLHAGMAPLATAGGIVLVALAPDQSSRIAAATCGSVCGSSAARSRPGVPSDPWRW